MYNKIDVPVLNVPEQLSNFTYPMGSHYGAATRTQGYKLKFIWMTIAMTMECLDNTNPTSMFYPEFPPLNNAPSNWSAVDLDKPYSRDSQSRLWVRGCGGLSVTSPINSLKDIVYPHLIKNLIWIKG